MGYTVSMRAISSAAVAALVLLCGPATRADDTNPPVIAHTPVTRGDKGKQTPLFARITDESKIFPQVFFRFGPASGYEKPIDMKQVRGQRNQWGANLPAPPGNVIEYYLEAYDEFGNGPARAGDPDRPFRIEFGPQIAHEQPTLPLPAVARSTAGGGGGGRVWTWLVGGTGLGLLVGGIVANPLGARATALDVTGAALIAAGVALYFVEAPKDAPAAPPPDRRAEVRVGAAPLATGGAVALTARF